MCGKLMQERKIKNIEAISKLFFNNKIFLFNQLCGPAKIKPTPTATGKNAQEPGNFLVLSIKYKATNKHITATTDA